MDYCYHALAPCSYLECRLCSGEIHRSVQRNVSSPVLTRAFSWLIFVAYLLLRFNVCSSLTTDLQLTKLVRLVPEADVVSVGMIL